MCQSSQLSNIVIWGYADFCTIVRRHIVSIDSVDVISQLNSLSIKYIMSEFSCSLKAEQITFFLQGWADFIYQQL